MSVGNNRISAVHPTGRRILKTRARLAAWAEARQLGLTPAQSDLIADAALNRVIETLESWERDSEPAYVAEPAAVHADRIDIGPPVDPWADVPPPKPGEELPPTALELLDGKKEPKR